MKLEGDKEVLSPVRNTIYKYLQNYCIHNKEYALNKSSPINLNAIY